MGTEIPEAANMSSTNGSDEEEQMDNDHEDHDKCLTIEASLEAVTNDPIDIIDRPAILTEFKTCLLYTSPSPRDQRGSRMPSSA